MGITEMNENEPLMTFRNGLDVIKTKGGSRPWDEPRGNLITD